ncbi:hypothetical protein [Amphritea japonica]|uniref:hypothetical protein n=1 Tax=Amphritea japonica TaxID=452627 RepID=UPI0003668AE0|nr:hypothetical protein [Amphritea japonica]
MQRANNASKYEIHRHRLIEEQEMIQFQDPHCPISIVTEESCWIENKLVSLETTELQTH